MSKFKNVVDGTDDGEEEDEEAEPQEDEGKL